MSPPPYTIIPLHPLPTASTGLTFLYQRQCPHHHIPLFHCIHCIHWFDLFAPKTMSPPPYTTIPLHPLRTASTCLTFLHQRQCLYHHIPLFCCILHPLCTASTGLTFLHQRQCPHHHIPLFHCVLHPLHTASTGLTFLYQRQCPHHHIQLFYCIHCILRPHHRVTFV